MDNLSELATRLLKAKKVAIFMHVRPDGDAIGCALALSHALSLWQIESRVYSESDLPSILSFLPDFDKIESGEVFDADTFVSVDCATVERLGKYANVFLKNQANSLNIDHHITNERFARFNYVRCCSANAMNVLNLLEETGVGLDSTIAECLTVGIMTDSGCFTHDDVTEELFLSVAKLKALGADINKLNYLLFKKQTKARASFFAEVINGIRYALDDRLAYIVVKKDMLEKYALKADATEGFVDFPLTVDGVEVSMSILEMKQGQYKISLRSKTCDVNKVAGVFGGGGHKKAAGCMLFGELEEAVDKLTYAVSQYLD